MAIDRTLDSYEEWVIYVFDRPVPENGEQEWYWDWDTTWWNELEHPHEAVEYLTRAFENIAELATHFTDAQLNQALWYLNNNACSSHMFALMNAEVPWPDRQRCIRSFYTVYEQLFMPRCTPFLSHRHYPNITQPVEPNPLNSVCYMWWDINPVAAGPDDMYQQLNDEILLVMEKTLDLDSEACREGALHGLGHWHFYRPERVEAIIDRFLQRYPNISPELAMYARSARGGCVL